MTDKPLVSVICLCYNHASFVEEAIDSVLNQTYPNIQLIVVDDASEDTSKEVIQEKVREVSGIEFLDISQNLGNCKAFNQGLAMANGEYIIDLAADDVLFPTRVARGVQELVKRGSDYGVNFTNAQIIDSEGSFLRNFYELNEGTR
ncbi:MAG: glycosyltransferase family A protein [Acidobacteriota bacterium]